MIEKNGLCLAVKYFYTKDTLQNLNRFNSNSLSQMNSKPTSPNFSTESNKYYLCYNYFRSIRLLNY